MDSNVQIIPPHLNAEVYRTFNNASLPSNLDYIRIHSDGAVLIGSSELTGRHWNGEALIYKNIAEAQKLVRDNTKSIYLTSGTADGCFLESSNKVLLCEDNGAVSIWMKSANNHVWHEWTEEISAAEHDDSALAVDCLSVDKEYVTVGADGNIKVWDINNMICIRNYASAHSKPIYGVSVQPGTSTKFATGSADQYLNLWDENIDKPVLELFVNDCCIRCLSWANENQIIFGDEAGTLQLIDVRNTEMITKVTDFPSPIHKLSVNADCDKVAVCCDNKIVSVCEISEYCTSRTLYHDRHLHKDFVRGLAWDVDDGNVLHTVGWDGVIKTHHIN